MKTTRLSVDEVNEIIRLYGEGLPIREVSSKVGRCESAVMNALGDKIRSPSEAAKLGWATGRITCSEETRSKLSEMGRKAAISQRKFWTKPERQFKEILNELGFGVRFPDYAKEILQIEDDPNPSIYFQYPIQRFVGDFVDVERHIVFRINGDFWHANPTLYSKDSLAFMQKRTLRQDALVKNYLQGKGWMVCDIWESEIYWNKPLAINKFWAARKAADPSGSHPEDARFDSGVAHQDWSERLKDLWFKKPRLSIQMIDKKCAVCDVVFKVPSLNKRKQKRKFCSYRCAQLSRRQVARPAVEILQNEIQTMSWLALGEKYGVSDNAVRKWARQYKLI